LQIKSVPLLAQEKKISTKRL